MITLAANRNAETRRIAGWSGCPKEMQVALTSQKVEIGSNRPACDFLLVNF